MVQRNYTNVGAAYRSRVEAVIPVLEKFGVDAMLPAMPGLAIGALIREFKIPKVDLVGWTPIFDPVGSVIMARGHFKNGRATIYAVDLGTELTPVLTDFDEGFALPSGTRLLSLSGELQMVASRRRLADAAR